MTVMKEDLDGFHGFAVSLVSSEQSEMTWLQLFECWRMGNPSVDEHGENIEAIREAHDAVDVGRVRPFSWFDSDFRERHSIASSA